MQLQVAGAPAWVLANLARAAAPHLARAAAAAMQPARLQVPPRELSIFTLSLQQNADVKYAAMQPARLQVPCGQLRCRTLTSSVHKTFNRNPLCGLPALKPQTQQLARFQVSLRAKPPQSLSAAAVHMKAMAPCSPPDSRLCPEISQHPHSELQQASQKYALSTQQIVQLPSQHSACQKVSGHPLKRSRCTTQLDVHQARRSLVPTRVHPTTLISVCTRGANVCPLSRY